MQMIDLMKRLRELDSKNPNVVKQPVSEVSVDYVANKVAGAMRDPKLGWPRAAQTLDKMSSKFGSNQSNQAVQRAGEKMTADETIPKYLDDLRSGKMENAFWGLDPSLQQNVSFLQHFADALDDEGMEGHADDVRDGIATAQRRQDLIKRKQGMAEGIDAYEAGRMQAVARFKYQWPEIKELGFTPLELKTIKQIVALLDKGEIAKAAELQQNAGQAVSELVDEIVGGPLSNLQGVEESLLSKMNPATIAQFRKKIGSRRNPNWQWDPKKEAERQAHNEPIDQKVLYALDQEMAARRREAGVDDNYRPIKKNSEQGVAEGFASPELEAKVRDRLQELEDVDPDNVYKIVADEFDMTEEELRDALNTSGNEEEKIVKKINDELEMGNHYEGSIIAVSSELDMDPREVDRIYRAISPDADEIPPINFGLNEGWKEKLGALGTAAAIGLGSMGAAQSAQAAPEPTKSMSIQKQDQNLSQLSMKAKSFSQVNKDFANEFQQLENNHAEQVRRIMDSSFMNPSLKKKNDEKLMQVNMEYKNNIQKLLNVYGALKEDKDLQECGPMGGMSQPHSPASINMTADSGAELTGMLRDIMQLAGLKQVGPSDLGHQHEPAVLSTIPSVGIAKVDSEPFDMKSMIAKVDSLNEPDDEEEMKEYSNDAPKDVNGDMGNEAMLNTGMHNHDQSGGEHAAKGRNFKNNPVAYPETMYENLMAEYRKFVSESQKKKLSEIQGSRPIDKFRSKPSWDDGSEPADKNSPYYVAWSGQAWDDEDTSRPKGDAGRILAINIEDKHTAQELAKHYDQLFKVGKFPDELAHSKYVDYSGTYVGSMKKMDSYDREMLNYDMKAGQVKDYSKSEI